MSRFLQARWYLALPVSVVSTLSLFQSVHATQRPVCQRAAEWVADQHGHLPTTLAEISKYPTIYQKTIYGNLAPAQRKALWEEKLMGYITSHTSMTTDQRLLVTEMLADLDVFTQDPNGILHATRERDGALANRLTLAFGGRETRDLFDVFNASADQSPEASARVFAPVTAGVADVREVITGIGRLLGTKSPAKAAFSSCSCYSQDPFSTGCPFSTQCEKPHAGDSCSNIGNFCGFSMQDPCDGLCY